ncbi:hypothetical protein YC2023_054171 [Brassica napus]
MRTSCWRLNDENLGQMNVDGVLFVFGRVEGASELHGNLLYGLEGADVMPQLKGKELLEFYSKNFQIRQVDVDEDPPDPIVSGAW